MLRQIGITPDAVRASDIDETPLRDETARLYVRRLARAKAEAVAPSAGQAHVLAADTVVAAGHRLLPKTESETDARRCLALLSGRRHRVYTAVVLRHPDGTVRERLAETIVAFQRLATSQQQDYLATEEWRGKAGGYAIQGVAASFVRFLSGSHSNVVGLPLFETAQLLRGAGWSVPAAAGAGL